MYGQQVKENWNVKLESVYPHRYELPLQRQLYTTVAGNDHLKRDHTVNVLKDSWKKCVQYAFSFIPIDFDDDVGDVVDDDTESTLFKFRDLVIE